jgi:hypothetical protein
MDNVRNDLVLCQCTLASSQYFSVLLSRGWAGRLGLLLIFILTCTESAAQQDQPVLRLLVLGSGPRPIRPAKPPGVEDAAVPTLSTPAARAMTGAFIGRPIDDALLADIRD